METTSQIVDTPAPASAPAGSGTPVLKVEHLHKRFRRAGGSIVNAVDDVSLEVHAGEVLVLLGPSGCGKTTLLRSVAGLEHPDAGRIEVNGKVVFDSAAGIRVPTEKRGLSMIFQSYALWPHMTAFDNVAYPLRSRKTAKATIEDRVLEVLEMVGIPELRNQHPAQMSGGQQQRVALARALVANDDLVLFDEPLSNVDARVREQLRFELAEMQQRLGFAAVYVTHDQVEALSLAHRIAVMGGGSVQQLGSPREIYAAPTSRYVANFVGTTNEIPGTLAGVGDDGEVLVDTAIGTIHALPALAFEAGDSVTLTCRPEYCELSSTELDGPNAWRAVIETSMFIGSHTEYLVMVNGVGFKVWSSASSDYAHGQDVWLRVPSTRIRALDGDSDPGAG